MERPVFIPIAQCRAEAGGWSKSGFYTSQRRGLFPPTQWLGGKPGIWSDVWKAAIEKLKAQDRTNAPTRRAGLAGVAARKPRPKKAADVGRLDRDPAPGKRRGRPKLWEKVDGGERHRVTGEFRRTPRAKVLPAKPEAAEARA